MRLKIAFEAKGLARGTRERGGNNLLSSSGQTEGPKIRSFESSSDRHFMACMINGVLVSVLGI